MVSSWRNERRIHLANRECVWCQGSSHILFHGAPVRIEYREFTFRTWLPREERVTLNTVSTFTTTVACPLILLQKMSRKPLSFLHPLWSQKGKLYDHFTIRLSIRWQITSKFDNVVKGYFQDRRIVFIYIYIICIKIVVDIKSVLIEVITLTLRLTEYRYHALWTQIRKLVKKDVSNMWAGTSFIWVLWMFNLWQYFKISCTK